MNEVMFVVVALLLLLLLFGVVHIQLCCWPFAPRHASFGAIGAFWCVLVSVGGAGWLVCLLFVCWLCAHLVMAERGCRF